MPSVVDPSTPIVFCEGHEGSLDLLLLAHILPAGRVFVRPVGGKRGMRAFIEGHLSTYGDSPPAYLALRDRDFDVEPPERTQLIQLAGTKPIYLTHRAAVENYFIDAQLIQRYWAERDSAPAWAHGPALSVSEIQNRIEESARVLAGYQAVRWALASLRPGPRWPEVGTTWTAGSGSIPSSLEYDDCLAEARRLVASYGAQACGIRPDRLTEAATHYHEQFVDGQFFADSGFLVWFHGKDHLASLSPLLAPSFPRRHYAAWAAENVDVAKHADLQELVSVAMTTGSQQEQGAQ